MARGVRRISRFPLAPGQRGEPVRDLQRRLAAAGFPVQHGEPGHYCHRTENAVRDFQSSRGLLASGTCDEATWRTIIEAGWQLGDRLLLLVAPNQRGDDVAELQSILARLGFDPGRADGILGPDTAHAIQDFQKNSGIAADGVCGAETIRLLQVLARQTGSGPGVTTVRELEALRAATSLADQRVIVGQFGGLSAVTRQLVQALRRRQATVIASDEPDAVTQAATANRFGATVYIGFESVVAERDRVQYFAVPQFESAGGRRLAELVAERSGSLIPDFAPEVVGMRLPVLRETRMPAVLIMIGSIDRALDQTSVLVRAILEAVERWASPDALSPESTS